MVALKVGACLSFLACSVRIVSAWRAAISPCGDIKRVYKDGQCCGSPGKPLDIPSLGNPSCGDLKAAFKERVCCAKARVANLQQVLFDRDVEAKLSLDELWSREVILSEYASNVGTLPPAYSRNQTHTAIINYTHRNLPHAMYYQYLPTGNATTPPLTTAATRGLWIERVHTPPYVIVSEFEKLEGRMGRDAGELFPGDLIKLFNRNGRNNMTSFQGALIDIRDPDRTSVRMFFAFTSDAMRDGFTYFGNVLWRNTVMNFPGIEEYAFELIPEADDHYDYRDYELMPVA